MINPLVAWSRTWRLVTYRPDMTVGARLYLALAPEHLTAGYDLIAPLLESRGLNHRQVRDPEVLRAIAAHPTWAGKAVVIDVDPAISADQLAAELDEALAGRGLAGPAYLAGARPVGGKSGLVFLRRIGPAAETDDRRQRLARLLGE